VEVETVCTNNQQGPQTKYTVGQKSLLRKHHYQKFQAHDHLTDQQNRRWIIFGVCASLFLMSLFYRASSAIIAPNLVHDLKLSHQALGLLGAAFFYSFAFVQIPLGFLLDRVGPRISMTVFNFIAVVGAVIFAGAGSVAGGIIGRALLGLGMAANLMGPLKLFTNWFDPRKFATISGLLISLGTVGSLAATSPLAIMVQTLGWRGSFYALAGLNSVLTICLITIVRDTPSDKTTPPIPQEASPFSSSFASMKALFSNWSYWTISLSTFLRYGSYASIQALWAGPFLIEFLGLSPVTAGNLILMLSIGLILGSPFGGMLSDRILRSRKRTIIIGLSISSVAIFFFSQWQSTIHLVMLGTLLFSIGFFNSFGQIVYAHIKELMSDEMSASAMTGVNFFTMMGGGVFMQLLGGVMQHMSTNYTNAGKGYRTSFLICSAAFFLATALYLTTKDSSMPARYKKEQKKEPLSNKTAGINPPIRKGEDFPSGMQGPGMKRSSDFHRHRP